MPETTVKELFEMGSMTLRSGNMGNAGTRAAKQFMVFNAADEVAACTAAYKAAPAKIPDSDGKLKIPRLQAQILERCNETTWKVRVEYGYVTGSSNSIDEDDRDDPDVPEVCFQCTTSMERVIKPLSQTCVYARSGFSVPNPMEVPIGWNGKFNGESQAEGVSVPVPEVQEQYVRILKYSTVRSSAWRRRIAKCVGRVNKGKFKGWNAGEALFMGASYNTPQRGVEKVKVTFHFTIRINESSVSVSGHPIGDVKGHEYVWAVMDDSVSSGALAKNIRFIFKSQLFKAADFGELGL